MTEIITTQRPILRTPVSGDLETLHQRIFSDKQVMRFVFGGIPLTLDRVSEFFDANFARKATGHGLGVLVEKNSSEVVGFSGLIPCNALAEKDYEIGFVLARSFWGQGYATEIGYGQLNYGFGKLGCKRLLAQVAPQNIRSIAVLKKIGMSLHSETVTEGRGLRQIFIIHN